jgi:aryl-alcohol dehydrogenase-like predicted oxidoreductase
MHPRQLGHTDLRIPPLVIGANVFGWTADKPTSFALLDRLAEAGLSTIDTADVYSNWAPGNQGGESEAIIGEWLQKTGKRGSIIVITKCGAASSPNKGLTATAIEKSCDASLKRLRIETIDLYLSHFPDAETPYEETLGAFERLRKAGKIRWYGTSNLNADQLRASLEAAKAANLPRYEVLQPEYNLYDRAGFDGPLRDLCMSRGIGVITYFSLAKGFLSGKYRGEADLGQSARGGGIKAYLNPRGFKILAALDEIGGRLSAKPAEVALAWLIHREGVTAPIASATTLAQAESLIRATWLALSAEDMTVLDTASAL